MNGLEAIKLMEQGKIVVKLYTNARFKIVDNIMYYFFNNNDAWKTCTTFRLEDDYKEYIETTSLTGWERVERDDVYYFIGSLDTTKCRELNDDTDSLRYEQDNYFSTESKAEEIDFKQTLFRKLQRFSDENGGNEIDWNDHYQEKYCIRYNHSIKKIEPDFNNYLNEYGKVYFISKEVAEQVIELFHDELTKYFTM